jgi:uncharacterized protein (DUF697 family)
MSISEPNQSTFESESDQIYSEANVLHAKTKADHIVNKYTLIAVGIGVVPSPTVNSIGVLGLELQMINELAVAYNYPFPTKLAMIKVFSSLIGSLGPVYFALKSQSALSAVPVFGTLLAASIYSISGGISVYAVGKIFQNHFESGGTLISKNNAYLRKLFKSHYDEGKVEVPKLIAISNS